MDWRIPVVLAAGLLLILMGVLARLGTWRRWEQWWRDHRLPFYLRNGWAGLIPTGTTLVLAAVAGLFAGMHPYPVLPAVLVVGAAFLGMIASILMMYRPPRWAMPAWMRREEADLGVPERDRGWLTFDRMFLTVFVGILLTALLLVVRMAFS